MLQDLERALSAWFWADALSHGGDAAAWKAREEARSKLIATVGEVVREYLKRYLRLKVFERSGADPDRTERQRSFESNMSTLESAREFFENSMTQQLQSEFVYIGEELDARPAKNHKKYISKKIQRVCKEFIGSLDDFAEDFWDGSPGAKKALAKLNEALTPTEITLSVPAGMVKRLRRKALREKYPIDADQVGISGYITELLYRQMRT